MLSMKYFDASRYYDVAELFTTPDYFLGQTARKKRDALKGTHAPIVINCDSDAIVIDFAPFKLKSRKIFVDGRLQTKDVANLVIASYVQLEIAGGYPIIYINENLAGEFKSITDSPYTGEFQLVYTRDSVPIKTFDVKARPTVDLVETTPHHVDFEIRMFGNKTPLFDIFANGKLIKRSLRKSDAEKWLIRLYQQRHSYANLTVEIPRVVAALFLDIDSRIVRKLNVTLTEDTPQAQMQVTA